MLRLFAKQVTFSGANMFAAATKYEIDTLISSNEGLSLYAMVDAEGVLYPFFDVDVAITDSNKQRCSALSVLEAALAEIKYLMGANMPSKCAVFDAWTPQKVSYHIHLDVEMKASVFYSIMKTHKSSVIDTSVYTRWRCFRLPGCPKLGKNNKLVPIDAYSAQNKHLAFIMTRFSEPQKTEPEGLSRPILLPKNDEKSMDFTMDVRSQSVAGLARKIYEARVGVWIESISVQIKYHATTKVFIVRLGCFDCLINGGKHDSTRPSILISANSIWLKCFSRDCADKSKVFLSWDDFKEHKRMIYPYVRSAPEKLSIALAQCERQEQRQREQIIDLEGRHRMGVD
jgi:hypothetical protein